MHNARIAVGFIGACVAAMLSAGCVVGPKQDDPAVLGSAGDAQAGGDSGALASDVGTGAPDSAVISFDAAGADVANEPPVACPDAALDGDATAGDGGCVSGDAATDAAETASDATTDGTDGAVTDALGDVTDAIIDEVGHD